MFGILRLFVMTTNLFVIANVKQLQNCSFRILLPFFQTSWGVGILNSAVFNNFHDQVKFGMILEGLQNFWGGVGGGLKPPLFGTPLVQKAVRWIQGSRWSLARLGLSMFVF